MTDDDHRCPWRDEAERLRVELDKQRGIVAELNAKLMTVMARMEQLERRFLGPKPERMPTPTQELRTEAKEQGESPENAAAARKRRRNAELKAGLETVEYHHRVPDEKRRCPMCQSENLRQLGKGKKSTVYEWIPGRLVRELHFHETLTCRCGEYVVRADVCRKAIEKGRYGPGFIAHVVTSKCADSIPFYRLEKRYKKMGIPIARSTMTDLFHAAAGLTEPLWKRLLERVAESDVVLADETSLKMQSPNKRGFVWTFLADELIAYRYSADRSGRTPVEVLGGTRGTLVVDAYTGYNAVTRVAGRTRAGCMAHARRKFFEALPTAPDEAKAAMGLILNLYRVEHEARERGILRTAEHRALRQEKAAPAMERFKVWLSEQRELHPPKSPIGRAIAYSTNNIDALSRYLENEKVPIDNNASERALRVVALGRKNFLFVGNEEAGQRLAGLYSLVSTCELHGVDPTAYLASVLLLVSEHPASRIDELLPDRWTPALAAA